VFEEPSCTATTNSLATACDQRCATFEQMSRHSITSMLIQQIFQRRTCRIAHLLFVDVAPEAATL
jgi:hypothetical protein